MRDTYRSPRAFVGSLDPASLSRLDGRGVVNDCIAMESLRSKPARQDGSSMLRFEEAHEAWGLREPHQCYGKEPWLPRLMFGGIALFDYDRDGRLDLLMLNQGQPDALSPDPTARRVLSRLYRNQADGTFVDVTIQSGLIDDGFALGVVAADLDHDGDSDVAIGHWGPVRIFENQGDGTFTYRPTLLPQAPEQMTAFGAGIACLDIDNDGNLDLFASNYVDFTIERYQQVAPKSFPYPPGPKDFPPSIDRLYRNRGDGTFSDVTSSSGIDRYPGPTMGVICGDFDDDGDADIFACSDAAPNQFFVNDGKGQFTDMALGAGLAFDVAGNVNGSMGVDAADFDRDGRVDFLITNYTGQTPVLYKNLGGGQFEDVSRRTQIGRTLLPHTNWGVGWWDVENDGDLDALIANGHFLKNIESIDDRTAFRVANSLMIQDGPGIPKGTGRFIDRTKQAGAGWSMVESSRGSAIGDIDNDGDLDSVFLNAESPPTLLINHSTMQGDWLQLELAGTRDNRDAIGAVVTVVTQHGSWVQMVHAGRGYQSHLAMCSTLAWARMLA